jgi:hypothetical protein
MEGHVRAFFEAAFHAAEHLTQGSSRRVEDLRLVTLGRQSFETSITRVRPSPVSVLVSFATVQQGS